MKNDRRGMSWISATLIAMVLWLGIGGARAMADPVSDKLRVTLQARLGAGATVKGVAPSPIPGLYEVNLGSQMMYSDATGNYVLTGDLIDTRSRTNVSEQRLAELNKIKFADLPLGDAVKVVKGDGSRKIAVFSDPNCPYCKRLESTLKQIDNVTVYTFLYPVLSADSNVKSKAVWCSADRGRAWEDWMVREKAPAGAGCDTAAIDKNLALGQKLGVIGTPTIFLIDGRRLPGAVPADQLEKELATG
jgi:thiol:disulfide interchange protein DsbC